MITSYHSDLHLSLCLEEVTSSSVQLLSRVQLFVTPWTAARQASLSITNSQSPPKPMSIESVKPSNHLTLCRPLLLRPSVFPSIRVLKDEEVLRKPQRGVGGARPRQPGRHGWCQHKNLTARAKTRSSSQPRRRGGIAAKCSRTATGERQLCPSDPHWA